MMARKAETYSPETHVFDLADLRQIWEMQESGEQVERSPIYKPPRGTRNE
jgi:hypothetical protein